MTELMFFWIIFKAVLFSTGGYGALPALHADLIAHGFATQKQFAEALSIGQITPGPNGLWIVSLAYLIQGVSGAIIACIALSIPPGLVLCIQLFYSKIAGKPTTKGLMDGLVLVIVSFSVVVLFQIFHSTGITLLKLLIVVVSAMLAIQGKISTNIILLAAAVIGILCGLY